MIAEPVMRAFYELLERKEYTVTLRDDESLSIEDDQAGFTVDNGEVECAHNNLERQHYDTRSAYDDSDLMLPYCNVCKQYVLDD